MKNVIYILATLIVMAIMGAMIVMIPFVSKGYHMYQETMKEESLEKRIEDVREKEEYVTIDKISPDYLTNLVQSEDHRFYNHYGIDAIAMGRAAVVDLKERGFVQGGSTITQQLAKNLCFDFEKKMERKVAEIFVARKLEQMLTKNEILELYCNVIYYGDGNYGIKEAALNYYGVEPSNLTEAQCKVLAKTIQKPSKYNPSVLGSIVN